MKYEPRFLSLREVSRLVGGRKNLIRGLREGTLRGQGWFVVEDEQPTGDADWLNTRHWIDGKLNFSESSLGVGENASYVEIRIEAKGLKKLLEIKSVGGRPQEHSWQQFEKILRDLARERNSF